MADAQAIPLQQWLQQLHTDGEGLSGKDAAERLQKLGPNALPEQRRSRLRVLLSTLMGCYGWLMAPVGWGWTAVSWAYALVWFLVFDAVKLLLYRLLDPRRTVIHPIRHSLP